MFVRFEFETVAKLEINMMNLNMQLPIGEELL